LTFKLELGIIKNKRGEDRKIKNNKEKNQGGKYLPCFLFIQKNKAKK